MNVGLSWLIQSISNTEFEFEHECQWGDQKVWWWNKRICTQMCGYVLEEFCVTVLQYRYLIIYEIVDMKLQK